MEVVPGTWYAWGDLFDDGIRLYDGGVIREARASVLGGRLQSLVMPVTSRIAAGDAPDAGYLGLQFTLEHIRPTAVEGLVGRFKPWQLLRENLLYIDEARFAFELLVRAGGLTCRSRGAVCATLDLDRADADRKAAGQRREVDTAFRRGLLDELRRSRADFKLGVRPMQRKIRALFDSEYVPDAEWRVDVLFLQWRDDASGEPVASPLPSGVTETDASLSFDVGERRGFRVSDLFSVSSSADANSRD